MRNTDHDILILHELFFKLSASVDAFISTRQLRKLRPATITFYRNELGYFLTWSKVLQLESLTDVTPQVLRLYFGQLSEKRTTANSVHCAYRAIKTWLKWCWEEYEIDTRCPIDRVEVEPPDHNPRPGISIGDVQRLIDSAGRSKHPKRNIAIFLFFLDTGIRRAEMVRLNVGDLDRDGSVILRSTTTKNRTPRKVYLVADTRRALAAYLREREELKSDDPLFASRGNTRFTPDGLSNVLRTRAKAAGIDQNGFHAFRRTFALESKRSGAGDIETSRLLGHGRNRGDLSQTWTYLDLDDTDLRTAHEISSPVKKLRKKRG